MRPRAHMALSGVISGVIRLLLVPAVVALGVVACGLAGVLSRALFGKLVMRWHRIMVGVLGVRTRYRGAGLAAGALLLCNHISWLDTLLFGGRWPVVFLGRSEIARWPVLGWMMARAGTLFIERGRGAEKAAADIGAALKQGRNVVLFPEGKTTDGQSVIRFQPRLAQAAIDAGAPVQPVAIRYFDAAGARVVRHSFAGEVTLMQSLWRTVSGPAIIAEITLFTPLETGDGDDRQTLARQAEDRVRTWVESGGG